MHIPAISVEKKRRFARAVLSGQMTRAEAYLAIVDSSNISPVKSAGRLMRSKTMKPVLGSVQDELDQSEAMNKLAISNAHKQLELAEQLSKEAEKGSIRERIAILKVIAPAQNSAVKVLKALQVDNRPISNTPDTTPNTDIWTAYNAKRLEQRVYGDS